MAFSLPVGGVLARMRPSASAEMFLVPCVGYRNVPSIPLRPTPSFVAPEKQDRFALGIEGEQDAQLASTARRRSKLLQIPVAAVPDRIDERTTELGSETPEDLDRCEERLPVAVVEADRPLPAFRVELDFPRSHLTITKPLSGRRGVLRLTEEIAEGGRSFHVGRRDPV